MSHDFFSSSETNLGFYSTPRSFSRSKLWNDLPLTYQKVFTTIMDHAAYKTIEMDDHGKLVLVKPGQFLTTQRELVELCRNPDIDRDVVRRALVKMKSLQILALETPQKKTLITITRKDILDVLTPNFTPISPQSHPLKEQVNKYNKNNKEECEEESIAAKGDSQSSSGSLRSPSCSILHEDDQKEIITHLEQRERSITYAMCQFCSRKKELDDGEIEAILCRRTSKSIIKYNLHEVIDIAHVMSEKFQDDLAEKGIKEKQRIPYCQQFMDMLLRKHIEPLDLEENINNLLNNKDLLKRFLLGEDLKTLILENFTEGQKAPSNPREAFQISHYIQKKREQSKIVDIKQVSNNKSDNRSHVVENQSLIMPNKLCTTPSKKSSSKNQEFSSEINSIAEKMIAEMEVSKKGCKKPSDLQQLKQQIDYMIRKDQRQPQDIIKVFCWAIHDEKFWRKHMFKPNPAKYLREKFDQLEVAMQDESEFIQKPSENVLETISKIFIDGQLYRGYKCNISPSEICFSSNNFSWGLKFSEKGFLEQLQSFCIKKEIKEGYNIANGQKSNVKTSPIDQKQKDMSRLG